MFAINISIHFQFCLFICSVLFCSEQSFPIHMNSCVSMYNKRERYCRHKEGRPKRQRVSDAESKVDNLDDWFESLPDDIVLSIICKLSSTAESPTDFINIILTCKRMKILAMNSMVLAKASKEVLTIKAGKWSDNAHRFLKLCSDSGNVEASYTLGMIRFYCLRNRASGASLMAKAAINSHAQALYSLAVIQFNGSGGSKSHKDIQAGVALCARAAFLGHIDALRELGHCLQDGYGVKQNITEGRRFLIQANARELAAWLPEVVLTKNYPCPLLSDFGCDVPLFAMHPANKFLTEWFAARGGDLNGGLRMCSYEGCGRPETRNYEFRRCSVCGAVNYCSRACQTLDWKLKHKAACVPVEQWINGAVAADGGNNPAAERQGV